MSKILAVIGGKQKGIADQVAIDPAFGCSNKCIGCYAKKSSQRGKLYDEVVEKELDYDALEKSIRKAKEHSFYVARIGKHCDPGNHPYSLIRILECCNNNTFRSVVVSKSLQFNSHIANLLIAGGHQLHMSLGPYSPVAPSDNMIVDVALEYHNYGSGTSLRFTRDVTQPIMVSDGYYIKFFNYIVTPMRYPSKEIMVDFYHADPENFKFSGGYYRPLVVHDDWKPYMNNACGEINGEVKCCNCNLMS